MTIKRRSNLFFGDEDPTNHPRNTYLWINTEENSLYFYDDEEGWSQIELLSASGGSGSANGGSGSVNGGPEPDEYIPFATFSSFSFYQVPSEEIYFGSNFVGVNKLDSSLNLDTSFEVLEINGQINDVEVQTDNKVLVVGGFTNVGGESRVAIARLNSNGTLDNSFNPVLTREPGWSPAGGPTLEKVRVLSNNKILISGRFDYVNSVRRSGIAILNSDGTLDTSFNAQLDFNPNIVGFDVFDNNDIIFCGLLSRSGLNNILKVDSFGNIDTSFGKYSIPAGTGSILGVKIKDNENILFYGNYQQIRYAPFDGNLAEATYKNIPYINKVNAIGEIDESFNIGELTDYLTPYIVEADYTSDNRIIITGRFSSINGHQTDHVAIINNSGVVDTSFSVSIDFSPIVYSAKQLSSENILIVGDFDRVNNVTRTNLAFVDLNGNLV